MGQGQSVPAPNFIKGKLTSDKGWNYFIMKTIQRFDVLASQFSG
jgi:hypothetical protein